jgi:hypothetical protein
LKRAHPISFCVRCAGSFGRKEIKYPMLLQRLRVPPQSRTFSSSCRRLRSGPRASGAQDGRQSQAYPLSGYYSEIISTPVPTSHPPPPKQGLGIVFGSRLASPGYSPDKASSESTWQEINGIRVPPRPEEPDNCCMSGCVNCVWDGYRDELESWAQRVQEAQSRRPQKKRKAPRTAAARDTAKQAATGVEPLQTEDQLFSHIPVGIREFMKTEKRLKEKHSRIK